LQARRMGSHLGLVLLRRGGRRGVERSCRGNGQPLRPRYAREMGRIRMEAAAVDMANDLKAVGG
jgi:hypothetical protein